MQLDEETFLNLSFHPAYNGAMPVADAALATALLIDRYMDLYHGDQVDGYSILERAGVIAADGYVEAAPAVAPSPTSSAAGVNRAELVQSLARQLLQVLAETEKEFNRLPIFVRPMARQGFKGKSGRALPDWQHSLEVLLQAFDENTAEAGTLQLPVEAAWIAHNLSGLARYYHEVPAETGRFTRPGRPGGNLHPCAAARAAGCRTGKSSGRLPLTSPLDQAVSQPPPRQPFTAAPE